MMDYVIATYLYTLSVLACLLLLDLTHHLDIQGLPVWRQFVALALLASGPVASALVVLAYGTRYRDAVLSWVGARVR